MVRAKMDVKDANTLVQAHVKTVAKEPVSGLASKNSMNMC